MAGWFDKLPGKRLLLAAALWFPAMNVCAADVAEEIAKGGVDFEDPAAARFDQWEDIVGDSQRMEIGPDEWELGGPQRPFDWVRHFRFRHSSTDGPNVGLGLPLEGTSWLNRPYHADWFLGSFLGDELIHNRISQNNQIIGGIRLGWDFDYYWGIEWRAAWSDPNLQFADPDAVEGPEPASVFMSDVDLMYYPWGDSRVRPYGFWGLGLSRFNFSDDRGLDRKAVLTTMPIGFGVKFHQKPWWVWRLELADNVAFGSDGLSSLNNISLTGGMELRYGARPSSYWPWRSSRRVW